MSRLFRLSSLALLSSFAAACAGHGSGGPAQPTPASSLDIVSISPADGATGVDPETPIVVVFSSPIDLPASGVDVSGPAGSLSPRLSVDGATLTVAPTRLADPGATLTAALDGVHGANGGALTPAKSWSFTLREDRRWLEPETLSTAPGDAPRIAIDADGRVTTAWRDASGRVIANRFDGAAGWTSKILGPENARDPAVVADGTAGVVAWVESTRAETKLLVARFEHDAWQAPLTLDDGPARIAEPKLVATENGPVLAWAKAGGEVWVTAAGLGAPARLSRPGSFAFSPRLANTPGGAVLVWRETDAKTAWILAARLSGGVWSAPVRLSAGGADAFDPAVVGVTGGVLAAWSQRTRGTAAPAPSLLVARLSDSGWSAPQEFATPLVTGTADVSGAGAAGITAPIFAADGAGGAWLLWRQRDGQALSATNRAVLKASHFTGNFAPASILDDGAAGDPATAFAAFDEAGHGLLAWRRGLATASRVITSSAEPGAGWSAVKSIGDPGARQPVTAASKGRAAIVWRRADGAIAVSRFD